MWRHGSMLLISTMCQVSKLRAELDAQGIQDPKERLQWYEAHQGTGYHNQPATNHRLLNVRA